MRYLLFLRRMLVTCLLLTCFFTRSASAQTTNTTDTTTTDTTTTTAEASSGGNVDLSFTVPQLNKALIDAYCLDGSGDNTISITLSDTTDTPLRLNSDSLYVWWAASSATICETLPATGSSSILVPQLTPLPTSLTASTSSFIFPEDITSGAWSSGQQSDFTVGDIIGQAGGCDTAEFSSVQLRLCFGIDGQATEGTGSIQTTTQTINNQSVAAEYNAFIKFEIDNVAPPKPDTPLLTPIDEAISITVAISSTGETDDIDSWRVYYQQAPAIPVTDPNCTLWNNSLSLSANLGNRTKGSAKLVTTPGLEYQFCVTATDNMGNISAPSAIASARSINECGFIECSENITVGYCGATTNGSPDVSLWLFIFTLLLLQWWRSKDTKHPPTPQLFLPIMIFIQICSMSVQAQMLGNTNGAGWNQRIDPAPHYHLELTFTPFAPNISKSVTNQDLFSSVYETEYKNAWVTSRPMMAGVDYTQNIYSDVFGDFGVGGGFNYWRISGKARNCGTLSSGCTSAQGAISGTSGVTDVTFTAMPIQAVATYRFFLLQRRWSIPVTFHTKIGVNYYYWWERSLDKVVHRDNGDLAQGGSGGYFATLGTAFNLDWLDGSIQKNNHSGLSGTWLMAEWFMQKTDHLGSQTRIEFSDSSWRLGLLLEFN